MADVEIKFEREGLEGIVAIGTYLRDAMRRFGIRYECGRENGEFKHDCGVTISRGQELLTPLTKYEREFFGEDADPSKRLACEARIDKPGEISVMTEEKASDTKGESTTERERYIKDFAELPLDKKISDLVKLEAMALGETISFILNSPYKVLEKIGDVMAGVGHKLDAEQKRAARPSEHHEKDDAAGGGKIDPNAAAEGA